jgi:hypothetical protein
MTVLFFTKKSTAPPTKVFAWVDDRVNASKSKKVGCLFNLSDPPGAGIQLRDGKPEEVPFEFSSGQER